MGGISMADSVVSYEKIGSVARITIHNESAFNAINEEVGAALVDNFLQAKEDTTIRAIIIAGAGKAFSAGGDVGYFYRTIQNGHVDIRPLLNILAKLAVLMKTLPKPIIASTQGAAAGAGFSLALLSDYCISADNCKFIQAFVNIGLVPDTGSLYLLTKAIGTARATDLVMSGRVVSATEAAALGLVKKVVPLEALESETLAFAKEMAMGPTGAYGEMKHMLYKTEFSDFSSYLEMEIESQHRASQTDDFKEGVQAFIEKRKAHFTGQ